VTGGQGPAARGPAARGPAAQGPAVRGPAVRADERCGLARTIVCDKCAAAVQVTKYSLQHTSVQWDRDSVRACAEFRDRVAAGQPTALIDTCASLRASIDRAVFLGRLIISSPIPPPAPAPISEPVPQPAAPPP
jgi:hypothetical protein